MARYHPKAVAGTGQLVTIPYTPRVWARRFHASTQRWKVLVVHRRGSKTTAGINHLQRDAMMHPDSFFAYVAPTYKQAKLIAWDMAKYYARPIPGVTFNEAELMVRYPNNAKLMLLGAENPDSLRGIGLWGGMSDEDRWHPPYLFTEVISKALADHNGYWIRGSTPKGKNHFYDVYQEGLKNPADYFTCLQTIDHTLAEEDDQIVRNLRSALGDERKMVESGVMTEDEFQQEWYCSFEAAIKGAYYAREIAQARAQGRFSPFAYDPAVPVHTVWDLGTGPRMAIGFYQKVGQQIRMIDYWEGQESEGLPQAVKAVQAKAYVYGKHFAPHDIRATDIGTGKTRLETAAALGIRFEVVRSIPLDDGINAGRLVFARLWVSMPKCQVWSEAMTQYRQAWDEKRMMFMETPYHDWTSHPADVHRYMALCEQEMTNDKQKTYQQKPYEPGSPYEGGDGGLRWGNN